MNVRSVRVHTDKYCLPIIMHVFNLITWSALMIAALSREIGYPWIESYCFQLIPESTQSPTTATTLKASRNVEELGTVMDQGL